MNHRRLLVVVVFLVIFSFDLARTTDIDFWWHLKVGQLIAQTGAVPRTDPFSYTAAGQPWTVHEWLWELIVFYVYGYGGYVTLVLLSATIVTITYAILYRLLRRLGANEILSGALVLWAAALGVPNFGVRPREVTTLFLAIYVSRLLLYREGRVRSLWLLPALMVLWVNLHGAFVLGIGLLGLCAVGTTLEWWWLPEQSPHDESPRHLWVVVLLTLGAASINPRGPWMLFYPFGYYLEKRNPSFDIVTEFQSPNFHQLLSLVFAAGIVLFMVLGVRRRRLNIVDGLLAVAFTLQALVSARQVFAAAEVMAPLLALVLCERFAWARELPPLRLPRRLNAVNWILLVCLVASYAMHPRVRRQLQLGAEPTTEELPVAGVEFIQKEHLAGPVFNDQPWGGYLIYRWYPERRVFIDGRIDMYGPEISKEYLQVASIKPEWRAVLDKYGVQTVLISKDSALSVLLRADGGWERVFQGEVEDVFVRRAGQQRSRVVWQWTTQRICPAPRLKALLGGLVRVQLAQSTS
jgi:hypothetical protein